MKNLIVLLALFISCSASAHKKVLMMIPNNFMWPEYSEPLKVYQNAGFDISTAGPSKEGVTPDKRNTTVGSSHYFSEAKSFLTDFTYDQVDVNQFDAITFVGGNGSWYDFFPNETVHKLVLSSVEKNKVLGFICSSTGLLGMVGNFDGNQKTFATGKKVVGYYRVEGLIKNMGKANLIPGGRNQPGVATDGNLVTGRNPESAQIFGEAVVKLLNSK